MECLNEIYALHYNACYVIIYFMQTEVIIKSCRYATEHIICTCIWLYMVESTIANAGW